MKKFLLTLLLLPMLALAQPPTTNYPTLKYDPTSGAFVPATTNGHTIGPASGIIVGTPAAGDVSVFNSASTIRTGTTSEVMKFTDDGTTFLAGWDGGAAVFKRFTLDSFFQVSTSGSDKLLSLNTAVLNANLDFLPLTLSGDTSVDLGANTLTIGGTGYTIFTGAGLSKIEVQPGAEGINGTDSVGDLMFQLEGNTGAALFTGTLTLGFNQLAVSDGTTGKIHSAALETVAIANGGTGQATASAAFDALAPSQTSNSGKYLTTNGTTTSWGTVATGLTIGTTTITSGTDTRLLYDNSGVLGEYTTVPVANGGTNIASYAVGDLLYASGSTTLSKLADVATGSVLISGGVTTAPAWSTTPTFTATNVTGLPVSGITASTSTALGVGSIELGNASDTTIARSGAGAITVEGTAVLLSGGALGTPSSGVGSNLTALNGSNISSGTVASARLGNVPLGSIGFTTDGAGATITTGVKGYFIAPETCTITGWSISADGASPTCTIDVWKVATGTTLPTVSNTIMGTKPALATGNCIRSTTMTGWSTATITAGDIIGFNVDALTVATKLTFQLETSK